MIGAFCPSCEHRRTYSISSTRRSNMDKARGTFGGALGYIRNLKRPAVVFERVYATGPENEFSQIYQGEKPWTDRSSLSSERPCFVRLRCAPEQRK
jgi:hypothetical protein